MKYRIVDGENVFRVTNALGEGDRVELPSGGKGVIVMEGGDDAEIDDKSVESGEVVVGYTSKQGYTIIDVGELEPTEFNTPDDVSPEDMKEITENNLAANDLGFDSWPDSWRDSKKPARLIALDAWASMGGTWRGCFKEIKSKRICSAFKDEILGTTKWR